MPWFLLIAEPILLGAFGYYIWHFCVELIFYRSHKWDFSINNPKGKKFYKGEYNDPLDRNLMTNEQRIWFGHPFFIFVIGILFLGFSYAMYRIQSCQYTDLKRCNIEVGSNEVTIH